ncbi:hypothetical protein, partial [Megamonas hypermegale]|uniref:hypothetical protein n=1 Tax=Megamonas hypermegale TaxID=158847 RepID=UPI0026F35196
QWGLGSGEKTVDINLNISATALFALATDAHGTTETTITAPLISISNVLLNNNVLRVVSANNTILGNFYWLCLGYIQTEKVVSIADVLS